MSSTPLSAAQHLFFSDLSSFYFFYLFTSSAPSPNSKDHTLIIGIDRPFATYFYPLFCGSRHHGAVQHVFRQAYSIYCPKDRYHRLSLLSSRRYSSFRYCLLLFVRFILYPLPHSSRESIAFGFSTFSLFFFFNIEFFTHPYLSINNTSLH